MSVYGHWERSTESGAVEGDIKHNDILKYLTFRQKRSGFVHQEDETDLGPFLDARLCLEADLADGAEQWPPYKYALAHHPIARRSLLFFPPLRKIGVWEIYFHNFCVENPYGVTIWDFMSEVQQR